MTSIITRILVDQDDIRTTRIDEISMSESLAEASALLAVDRFALTANNVTYAAIGRVLGYWDFFPAEDNWGCVPVWGYADVVASNCAGLAAGERLFGYMPMATHLIIQPRKITPYGLADGAPHRAKLASIYNRYVRVNRSRRDTSHEDRHMIFYPLFVTSFLMQDFFTEHDYFGARNIVVSSASSKTAMGFAHIGYPLRSRDVNMLGWRTRHPIPKAGSTTRAP